MTTPNQLACVLDIANLLCSDIEAGITTVKIGCVVPEVMHEYTYEHLLFDDNTGDTMCTGLECNTGVTIHDPIETEFTLGCSFPNVSEEFSTNADIAIKCLEAKLEATVESMGPIYRFEDYVHRIATVLDVKGFYFGGNQAETKSFSTDLNEIKPCIVKFLSENLEALGAQIPDETAFGSGYMRVVLDDLLAGINEAEKSGADIVIHDLIVSPATARTIVANNSNKIGHDVMQKTFDSSSMPILTQLKIGLAVNIENIGFDGNAKL
jgi:hypothetical protein